MTHGPPGAASALAELTHNRWALPVLAHVSEHGGCKLVTLTRRLGASASSLKRALARLAQLGLVIPNPGYGHPLRPEYILGPVGESADLLPRAIVEWCQAEDRAPQVFKKWQLPVLVAVSPESCRFSSIRDQLVGATPRAVAMALKSHAGLGLVARDVDPGYPPVPHYSATKISLPGREPAMLLGELLAASSRVAA